VTDLSSRILDFPVRAAAVDDFRRQLQARNFGDLSAVAAAIGDAALFSELLALWIERGWVVRAPSSPAHAFGGPELSRDLSLADFCGESIGYDARGPDGGPSSGGSDPGGEEQ